MAPSLYATVLDRLGVAIVDGTIPAGERMLLSDVEDRFGVSRTVARDVVKVLESLGLVVTRRRAGIVVLAQPAWQVLDPAVIQWRLRGAQRREQLSSLVGVREAIEPRAAALAAEAATDAAASRLVELAAEMTALGRRDLGRSAAYLGADIEFHHLLLTTSGNEMFAAMSGMIEAVLRGRSELGLTPARPDDRALASHEQIAAAVLRHDPAAAEQVSRGLFSVIRREVLEDRPEQAGRPPGAAPQEAHSVRRA